MSSSQKNEEGMAWESVADPPLFACFHQDRKLRDATLQAAQLKPVYITALYNPTNLINQYVISLDFGLDFGLDLFFFQCIPCILMRK